MSHIIIDGIASLDTTIVLEAYTVVQLRTILRVVYGVSIPRLMKKPAMISYIMYVDWSANNEDNPFSLFYEA